MDDICINKWMKKSSIYFVSIYSIIWLASGLLIPFFEYVIGGGSIGWSPGLMAWFYLAIAIPIVYFLIMAYLLFKTYANNKRSGI